MCARTAPIRSTGSERKKCAAFRCDLSAAACSDSGPCSSSSLNGTARVISRSSAWQSSRVLRPSISELRTWPVRHSSGTSATSAAVRVAASSAETRLGVDMVSLESSRCSSLTGIRVWAMKAAASDVSRLPFVFVHLLELLQTRSFSIEYPQRVWIVCRVASRYSLFPCLIEDREMGKRVPK